MLNLYDLCALVIVKEGPQNIHLLPSTTRTLRARMYRITVLFPLMIIHSLKAGTASQIYSCTFGETAKLLWRRSEREHLKEFRQYRAWKEEISFAIIINGSRTARCLDDILKTFCSTKVTFQIWNETHLLLTINNSSYDDSGDYSVEHVFEGLEDNNKSKVSLIIQAKPTDIIPSHHNLTKDDNTTLAKPTDIIPSLHNLTKDDNTTLDHSSTTARPAAISSGRRVLLTRSVPLIVPFLLFLL